MTDSRPNCRQFAVHGLAIELRCDVPWLYPSIDLLLNIFATSDLPEGFIPIAGDIQPYEPDQVLRHVSSSARRLPDPDELLELYQDGERFWLVDERWGLAEIDLLRRYWRAWVLPQPAADAPRVAEMAILWPLAQLFRGKGLHLLPAASVARDGWGALLLSPFGIEPELSALARTGWNIIGQRWTAVREDAGRIELLHMPGMVQRASAPKLRVAVESPQWVDLTREWGGCGRPHAFCQAVLVVETGRRAQPQVFGWAVSREAEVLRQAWPIRPLYPSHRVDPFPARLAALCRCGLLHLSRRGEDLLPLLDSLRGPAVSVQVFHRPPTVGTPAHPTSAV